MNYLNFSNSQRNVQSNYAPLSTPTQSLTSPKLGVSDVFTSSNTGPSDLTEICYHLSRTISSIASVTADARPLYTPKAYNQIFNDVRMLLPEAVENYTLSTTA